MVQNSVRGGDLAGNACEHPGVEIILNMREKMEAMQKQIESFVANLNQEFAQHAREPRPDNNRSLIPMIQMVPSALAPRAEARRESRHKQGR